MCLLLINDLSEHLLDSFLKINVSLQDGLRQKFLQNRLVFRVDNFD